MSREVLIGSFSAQAEIRSPTLGVCEQGHGHSVGRKPAPGFNDGPVGDCDWRHIGECGRAEERELSR
jgi:hypothetical protein